MSGIVNIIAQLLSPLPHFLLHTSCCPVQPVAVVTMTMLLLRDSSDEEQFSWTIATATHPNAGIDISDGVSSDVSNYISIQSDLELRWVDFSTDSPVWCETGAQRTVFSHRVSG